MFTKEEIVFTGTVTYDPSKQRALHYKVLQVVSLRPEQSIKTESDENEKILREFANFAIRITLRRNVLPHMLRAYLSSGVVVLTSFISFMIEPSVVPGRMALLVTLLLVLVNMR